MSIDQEVPTDKDLPEGDPIVCRFDWHVPSDLLGSTKNEVIGHIQRLSNSNWVYDSGWFEDGDCYVVLGVFNRTVEWAIDTMIYERYREDAVDVEWLQTMTSAGKLPVNPSTFQPQRREGVYPTPESVDQQLDNSGRDDRLEQFEDIAGDSKAKTDELREDRQKTLRKRRQQRAKDRSGYGKTGADEHTENLPAWRDPEAKYGYKLNKKGLLKLYEETFRKTFSVDPPDLYTKSGRPSAAANKLWNISKDYDVETAQWMVNYAIDYWDDLQKLRRFTGPPTPGLLHNIRHDLCYHHARGDDPLEEMQEVYDKSSEEKGKRERERKVQHSEADKEDGEWR